MANEHAVFDAVLRNLTVHHKVKMSTPLVHGPFFKNCRNMFIMDFVTRISAESSRLKPQCASVFLCRFPVQSRGGTEGTLNPPCALPLS